MVTDRQSEETDEGTGPRGAAVEGGDAQRDEREHGAAVPGGALVEGVVGRPRISDAAGSVRRGVAGDRGAAGAGAGT